MIKHGPTIQVEANRTPDGRRLNQTAPHGSHFDTLVDFTNDIAPAF